MSIRILNKILRIIKKYSDATHRFLLKKILISQAHQFKEIEKINIGCGGYFVKGWLNIGLFSWRDYPEGIIIKKNNGALILNADINKAGPIFSGNIKYIYASHFIEHLSHEEAMKFLEVAHAGMRRGGIIRLTCPDLTLWVKKYYENDMAFFDKYKSIYLENEDLRTKGDIFMGQCHGFGHGWNYDFESLKDMMERTGFSKIIKKAQFDSLIPQIKELEPASEGRRLETVYVEGLKE